MRTRWDSGNPEGYGRRIGRGKKKPSFKSCVAILVKGRESATKAVEISLRINPALKYPTPDLMGRNGKSETTVGPVYLRSFEWSRAFMKEQEVSPEVKEMMRHFFDAEEAFWKVALAYEYVAAKHARTWSHFSSGGENDVNDLLAEGLIGLYNAAVRYDPESGNQFSTYGNWWCRAGIARYVSNTRPLKVSGGISDLYSKINRVQEDAFLTTGNHLTLREISVELGETVEKIESCINSFKDFLSLSAPLDDDSEQSLMDLLVSPVGISYEDNEEFQGTVQSIKAAMNLLPERSRKILRKRYGFDSGETRTLADVGLDFDISRERVRQIEKDALKFIRERCGIESRKVD